MFWMIEQKKEIFRIDENIINGLYIVQQRQQANFSMNTTFRLICKNILRLHQFQLSDQVNKTIQNKKIQSFWWFKT